MKLSDIIIGHRYRKELGNIQALADSIDARGLLHPPVVTTDRQLVAGFRRVKAAELLGWDDIEVRVVDPDDLVMAERDENDCREDFTPSERVAIAREIERRIGNRRGQRTDKGDELPHHGAEVVAGEETRQTAAKSAGFNSHGEFQRAATVVDHGVPELVEAVDAGEVSVSAAAEVAALPADEQRQTVKAGPKAVKERAKQQREAKKDQRTKLKTNDAPASTAVPGRTHPSANASDVHEATDVQVETPADEPARPTKVLLPPARDAWGIPVQDHAAEAFAAIPKFKELLRMLRAVQGELTELVESPGGHLLLRRCQFRKSDNKHGGRWVLADLDNAIGQIEDATPAHTDCPYHFNTFQPHDGDGRPCPLCNNRRVTGNLKRFQVPPELLEAMRTHYGVTEESA